MKGVCSLLGGVGVLEGIGLADIGADFDDNGGRRMFIMVGESRICLPRE